LLEILLNSKPAAVKAKPIAVAGRAIDAPTVTMPTAPMIPTILPATETISPGLIVPLFCASVAIFIVVIIAAAGAVAIVAPGPTAEAKPLITCPDPLTNSTGVAFCVIEAKPLPAVTKTTVIPSVAMTNSPS
jgi:hypothetical protein